MGSRAREGSSVAEAVAPLTRIGALGSKYRVIFGQGVGGLALHPWTAEVVNRWSRDPRLSHVEFFMPTPPTRSVSMKGGEEMPAWFNLEKGPAEGPAWVVNREHLEWAKNVYIELAHLEGGEIKTTVFSGFSNGGAVALYAGVQGECAGVLSLSGVMVAEEYLVDEDLMASESKPILLCYGNEDPIVPPADADGCLAFLQRKTPCDVELKMFDRKVHGCTDVEANAGADWLARVLMPASE